MMCTSHACCRGPRRATNAPTRPTEVKEPPKEEPKAACPCETGWFQRTDALLLMGDPRTAVDMKEWKTDHFTRACFFPTGTRGL